MRTLILLCCCCLMFSACARAPKDDTVALTTKVVYYTLDEYSENYSIDFPSNQTHLFGLLKGLPSYVQFNNVFDQFITRERIRYTFDEIYKVQNAADAGEHLFLEFGLLDYYYNEAENVDLTLNIRLFYRGNIVFERSYRGRGRSQDAAEFLKAPAYGRANIVLQATENALDDVFAHFKNDFFRAKRYLGFPFRYSGGWYKEPGQ